MTHSASALQLHRNSASPNAQLMIVEQPWLRPSQKALCPSAKYDQIVYARNETQVLYYKGPAGEGTLRHETHLSFM
jgi:hypothetical protein